MTDKLPVVILISGHGSNMCALADRAKNGDLPIEIHAVISDRPEAPGLLRAQERGIETAVLRLQDFNSREDFDIRLGETVERFGPRLVLLAGYMKILSSHFVRKFAGRLLNIHPSLLPKYSGLRTHQRALEAGDREHGASVHFVTEELDGGPLVIQGRISLRSHDTVESLSAKVHLVEHMIYPQAVEWFASGRLELREGVARMDGRILNSPIQLAIESANQ